MICMTKVYLIKIIDSGRDLSYWLESDVYTFYENQHIMKPERN